MLGVAIGDALGVPYEFKTRLQMKQKPATEMVGFGTYNQQPGTFSDDASLTFCFAETLTHSFDLQKIAINFLKWYDQGYWTAHGDVFDIGIQTQKAFFNIENGVAPELCGGIDERSNGNGSLMRILPLVFYNFKKTKEERFVNTELVSAITHRHIRSVIACFYYLEFANYLIYSIDKFEIYNLLQKEIPDFLRLKGVEESEINKYNRIFDKAIYTFDEDAIQSSGYVVASLEASIWCLLTTNTYQEAVLKAVNLGGDTDTIAAITGGLAALLYGYETIPEKWLNTIAKKDEIIDLGERLSIHFQLD